MLPFASRAGHWPLALTLAAVASLAACSDEPSTATGPRSPLKPNLAFGDIITVTNTSGGTDAGSLRWAVAQATFGEIIRFDATIAGKTIVVDSTVKITEGITIEGSEDKGITIHGGNKVPVFAIDAAGPSTFRNLTITGGKGGSAAFEVAGLGGLTLEHSTVTGNTNDVGPVIVGTYMTFINSTITSNTSEAAYPTIFEIYKLTVINSTITNNSSGGILGQGPLVLRNSIVADNGTGPNCRKDASYPFTVALEGANLADDTTCGDATVMLIAEPQLDSLKDNGGPTRTRRPLPASPVRNAGKNCDVPVDQRYVARDATCDLGAVEDADYITIGLTIDGGPTINPTSGATTVTGSVQCSRPSRFDVTVQLKQTQKGRSPAVVQAEGVVVVDCSATPRSWGITFTPTSGGFTNGAAIATVTLPSFDWLTTSSVTRDVKLYWGHK